MDTVLFWGIIAILCATCESIGIWKHGLSVGFIITTTLLAIHYDFGNDYWSYYDWFETSLYTPFPDSISAFLEISRDPGWDILNISFAKLFGEKGFYVMVALLSIVEGLCYCTFIKTYVPQKWYWLSMAIYILDQTFFILTFSMMRQSLVMAILLLCIIWIQQRKIIAPILVILLASTIHNSVLLCLPLVFISHLPLNNQRALAITLTLVWLLFLTIPSILEPILAKFASITELFTRYVDTYTDDGGMKFGLGYLLQLIPFFYFIYGLFVNKFTKEDLPIYIIWSLTIILTPFRTVIPLFGRLLFYFDVASIVVYPKILTNYNSTIGKFVLVISILVLATYTLYTGFFDASSIYYEYYVHFHTIFEAMNHL